MTSLKELTESKEVLVVCESNLAQALQLIRDALDSNSVMGPEDIDRLHTAEDLLAAELGHPIWEGVQL